MTDNRDSQEDTMEQAHIDQVMKASRQLDGTAQEYADRGDTRSASFYANRAKGMREALDILAICATVDGFNPA